MTSPAQKLLLLGADHPTLGALELRTQADSRTACAISVGSAADDGVKIFKGDLAVPNEDALVALDDGPLTLLAVLDGHHGHEASHDLAEQLAALPIPKDPLLLLAQLARLADVPATDIEAATTLLVAVVDRARGAGFGVSFGDWSALVLGEASAPRMVNRKSRNYVSPWTPGALDPRGALEFGFMVTPGEMLVLFTDGVDECHYGKPATSIGQQHLWNLLMDARGNPERYVQALAELALAGVEGNPGGQDNLAIAATLV